MSVMSCCRKTMANNIPLEKNPNREKSWLAISLRHASCRAFLLLRIVRKWGRTHHIQKSCSVCFASAMIMTVYRLKGITVKPCDNDLIWRDEGNAPRHGIRKCKAVLITLDQVMYLRPCFRYLRICVLREKQFPFGSLACQLEESNGSCMLVPLKGIKRKGFGVCSEVSHLHKYPVLAQITIISCGLTWLVFPPLEALTIHSVPYGTEFKSAAPKTKTSLCGCWFPILDCNIPQ